MTIFQWVNPPILLLILGFAGSHWWLSIHQWKVLQGSTGIVEIQQALHWHRTNRSSDFCRLKSHRKMAGLNGWTCSERVNIPGFDDFSKPNMGIEKSPAKINCHNICGTVHQQTCGFNVVSRPLDSEISPAMRPVTPFRRWGSDGQVWGNV